MDFTEERNKIADFLRKMPSITAGLGNEEEACTIAAINLALSGYLGDETPACARPKLCKWVIRAQDGMPDEVRNSPRWRAAVPLIAGTWELPDFVVEQVVVDWLYDQVLPQAREAAAFVDYGEAWDEMVKERSRFGGCRSDLRVWLLCKERERRTDREWEALNTEARKRIKREEHVADFLGDARGRVGNGFFTDLATVPNQLARGMLWSSVEAEGYREAAVQKMFLQVWETCHPAWVIEELERRRLERRRQGMPL